MHAEARSTRGHNEGSIFRRRTGEWIAAVTLRSGKRATRWSKSREEAKADLAELLRLRDAGARDTSRVRLGDYLERWLRNDHGLAPSTYRKHETVIRVHLAPRLGHIRLSELRPDDVSGALGELRQSGLGGQSVRHVRATLRRALADALRDGLVTRNAAGLSVPPKLQARERPVLDADQARLLIESTRGSRHGPLWTILVTTGMRISEALGLAWSDVDFGGNRVDQGPDLGDADSGDRRAPEDNALRRSALGDRTQRGRNAGADAVGVLRRPGVLPATSTITVRHALQRVQGEWQLRPPKTAKGRRTIPLTALGVEALRAQRALQLGDRYGDDMRALG